MVLPLDMPDDYPWLPGSGKAQLGDLGELAARLGSINTYDRRGSVYWMDDFENGLSPWLQQPGGLDALVEVVNYPVFRGDMGCRCTTASDANQDAGILKRLQPALLTTFGVECTFSLGADIEHLELQFLYKSGTWLYVGKIQLNVLDQKVYYYSAAGAMVEITTIDLNLDSETIFYTCKFVVDLLNKEYVRFMINQLEYDLGGITLRNYANVDLPRIEVLLSFQSELGNNGVGYFDSVIVTVGDP